MTSAGNIPVLSPTDDLIQRAEALAEEKPTEQMIAAAWKAWSPLAHNPTPYGLEAMGKAIAAALASSSGRELVPELVRALKEAVEECQQSMLTIAQERVRAEAAETALSSANWRNSETIEACARAVEVFFQGSTYAGTPEGQREFERDNLTAALLASRVRALLSNPAVAQETKE